MTNIQRASLNFFNAYDDQYTFEIKVYEGENEYANENELLETFVLENIPKKKTWAMLDNYF